MKITALETIHLPEYPSILFVAVHTDAGLTARRERLLGEGRGTEAIDAAERAGGGDG